MKQKADIKIIFVDLDWTLFDHNKLRYSSASLKALQKARNNGIKVIISTSRCYLSLMHIDGINKIPNDGYICSNGGVVFVDNKYLYRNFLPKEDVKEIIKLADKNNQVLQFITSETSFLNKEENSYAKGYYDTWYEPRPIKKEYCNEDIVSIVLFAAKGEEKDYLGHNYVLTRFYEHALDIAPFAYTKDNGIDAILKYFNIPKSQAMAIGDGEADIDMFKVVDYSIAMGNASDSVKQKAAFVTAPVHRNGVKKALKRFKTI